jgi:ribosomal protein S18 acetylase RimI-like enzyme
MRYKTSPRIITRLVPKAEVSDMVPALARLERVFPSELRMSRAEVRESVEMDGAVVFVAESGGKVVGASYCNTMESIDRDFFEGYWDPAEWLAPVGDSRYDQEDDRHDRLQSLYVTSTAVHPKYRRLGIATALKLQSVSLLRHQCGYILGHSNSGAMTKTYLSLGGEKVKLFKHWYGSKESHWLCQIWAGRFDALWPVPPVKQANDWDCGVAAAAQLLWFLNSDAQTDYAGMYSLLMPSMKYGIDPTSVAVSVTWSGGACHAYSGDTADSRVGIDFLRRALLDTPVLVDFQSRWGGHYVNMIGMSGETLYYWDVADARVKHIEAAEFEKRWYSKRYGKRIMIVPERS